MEQIFVPFKSLLIAPKLVHKTVVSLGVGVIVGVMVGVNVLVGVTVFVGVMVGV